MMKVSYAPACPWWSIPPVLPPIRRTYFDSNSVNQRYKTPLLPIPSLSQSAHKLNLRAYDKRNVYKSIIRHMLKLIKKNSRHFVTILKDSKFELEEIEESFRDVKYWAEQEKQKGKPKASKRAIEKMLTTKTIHSYILRETLKCMIQGWQNGNRKRILQENFDIYKEVCEEYYRKVDKLINN